uniref:Uncharacterized protein n=1 Tax=Arundo donax TaxID=35708 RepID=A0A0A9AKR4_ARUDO
MRFAFLGILSCLDEWSFSNLLPQKKKRNRVTSKIYFIDFFGGPS